MILLAAIGYITVRAYASRAVLPLQGVSITVTAADGTAIAIRTTDRNGLIRPIEVPVPAFETSQTPNPTAPPFTIVNLFARLPKYEPIEVHKLQVFANTTTIQNLEMVPLAQFPSPDDTGEVINTPPQNL